MSRQVVALLAFATGLLGAGTACQVVEPAPMAHTEDIPVKRQSVVGLLYGKHATIACEGCHIDQPPPYAAVADDCLECHRADRRDLHSQGKNHMADATTCGGSGCHSVAHKKWSDWSKGTQITTEDPDTNDTATTTDDCLLDGPVANDNTCANECHGETNGFNPAPDDASHRAHTVLDDAELWNLVDPSSASTDNCSVCHPAGGQGAPTHWDCKVDVVLQGIPGEWVVDWESHATPGTTTGTTTTTASTADTGPATTAVAPPGPVGPPTYDAVAQSCANVYCHGAGMFEAKPDPVWGDPAYGECGACHGSPPSYNIIDVVEHPDNTSCGLCHPDTADNYGTSIVTKPLHINGVMGLL